jgi:hypothetical protein
VGDRPSVAGRFAIATNRVAQAVALNGNVAANERLSAFSLREKGRGWPDLSLPMTAERATAQQKISTPQQQRYELVRPVGANRSARNVFDLLSDAVVCLPFDHQIRSRQKTHFTSRFKQITRPALA